MCVVSRLLSRFENHLVNQYFVRCTPLTIACPLRQCKMSRRQAIRAKNMEGHLRIHEMAIACCLKIELAI